MSLRLQYVRSIETVYNSARCKIESLEVVELNSISRRAYYMFEHADYTLIFECNVSRAHIKKSCARMLSQNGTRDFVSQQDLYFCVCNSLV